MITFELYRQLDIRVFQTVAAVDPTYGSCAKYILEGDSLILLGTDHSIRLNISSRKFENDVPMKNWDIETEAVLWFSEESTEAAIIVMILNAYRHFLKLDNGMSAEQMMGMVQAMNQHLAQYELKIIVDDSGMCIFHEDRAFTFEDAINLIMDIDENRMDNGGMIDLINEALYYRKIDRMEDAARSLEKVVRYADHTQAIYTDAVFLLAETYYFAGNFKRAVELYYRCHMEYIEDQNDFYIHLGHALLDERMKKYERQIRIFYRARIDAEYADSHRQQVVAASTEISSVFDEYEQTCLEMGEKKYQEFRNNLPADADDIDELMFFEKEEVKSSVRETKRYKDIRLVEPTTPLDKKDMGVQELLQEALELFINGDYQKAFEMYFILKGEVAENSDYATWVYYMLGRLYAIFDEPLKAQMALKKCDPNRFGKVYRQDDFLVLHSHVHILCEDFESDIRFRILIRGRYDNYFAQYDREYNNLLKDRKVMKAFRSYEEECEMTGRLDFKDVIVLDEESVKAGSKKGLFKKVGSLFKHKGD